MNIFIMFLGLIIRNKKCQLDFLDFEHILEKVRPVYRLYSTLQEHH